MDNLQAAVLADLQLEGADMAALACQGFVHLERRQRADGSTGHSYKLRWRCQGRQRVRYLGPDPQRAAMVRSALVFLHHSHWLARQVKVLLCLTRAYLRRALNSLATSHRGNSGGHYHGYFFRSPSLKTEPFHGQLLAPRPTTPAAPATQGAPAPASTQARAELIARYQSQALGEKDVLSANLGVISADLMRFAHHVRERIDTEIAEGAVSGHSFQAFEQRAGTYLQFIRQIDRLAQIERQFAQRSR